VAVFFALAFLGAAIFVYLTFPRTKEEIPTSNNQRPFPSAPMPSPNTPNSVPVPESVPHPNVPKVPAGPTLRVMAWATEGEARQLEKEAESFGVATGRHVSLTVDGDPAEYRRDLQQALASDSPPDLVLISARDFTGLDPARDLADAVPMSGSAPRSVAAFTVGGRVKATPTEFSVEVLFYNRHYFDEAGLGYPGPHWTWDILEADARALDSLKLKTDAGQPVYPLELRPDFDLWNIFCTQAGHPALDQDVWHLADDNTKESQMRALDFIHEIFTGLSITAPLPKAGANTGTFFERQQSALMIAPSTARASLLVFPWSITVLPQDMERASLARVNGWAVPARAGDKDAARALADYLAFQPVHAGWSPVSAPATDDSPEAVCFQAMSRALVPRIEPRSARMAQFLDAQINTLARNPSVKTDTLYAQIQTQFQGMTPPTIGGEMPQAAIPKPAPKIQDVPQLRGE
jgi:ABC-type glycerol-3-phosphate transport system substrate-binding protein